MNLRREVDEASDVETVDVNLHAFMRPQRSAQLFTIEPHRRQSSLQFRHQTSVDPHTSQTSGTGSRGAVIR